jgi:hypothetical protein
MWHPMSDCRRELIRIMARIEQLMSEAEGITAGNTDDEILRRTSNLLAEHTRMLADVEKQLRARLLLTASRPF